MNVLRASLPTSQSDGSLLARRANRTATRMTSQSDGSSLARRANRTACYLHDEPIGRLVNHNKPIRRLVTQDTDFMYESDRNYRGRLYKINVSDLSETIYSTLEKVRRNLEARIRLFTRKKNNRIWLIVSVKKANMKITHTSAVLTAKFCYLQRL